MNRIRVSIVTSSAALLLAFSAVLAAPQQEQASTGQDASAAPPRSALELLLDEIAMLNGEITQLRRHLAEARMQTSAAQQELDELRQFMADQHEFGDDFQQYKEVKKIAERESRQRRNDELRVRRETQKATRLARQAEQRDARSRENADSKRLAALRKAGFGRIGLDVLTGKMAYSYKTKEAASSIRVDYDPLLGRYLRPYGYGSAELDYSSMTISGSVVNGAAAVRNVGIAIAFFDDYGNQVGGEIIQINNARPDVPYPFTSTVDMALNRAFSSSSTYVLYADEIVADDS